MVQRRGGAARAWDEVTMPADTASRPLATVAHRLPGRTRLLVPARRGDAGFFADVIERARGLPAVRAAWANPITASLLLEHEGDADPIARELGFDLAPAPPARQRRPARRGRVASVAPLGAAAAGFGVLATLQLARGRLAGSATENLWNAFTALRTMRRPGLAVVLAGAGAIQLVRGQVLGSALSLAFYAVNARRMARGQ